MPSGTVSENALVALPNAMLALRIRSCASSSVIPVSFGQLPDRAAQRDRDRHVGALEDALAGRRVGAQHQPRVDRVGVLRLGRLHVEPGVLEPLLRLLGGELQDRGRGGVAGVAEVPGARADRGGDQEREHQQDRPASATAWPLGRLGGGCRRRDRLRPIGDGRRLARPLDRRGRLARRRQQRGHRGVVPRLRTGVAPRRSLAAEHLGGVAHLAGQQVVDQLRVAADSRADGLVDPAQVVQQHAGVGGPLLPVASGGPGDERVDVVRDARAPAARAAGRPRARACRRPGSASRPRAASCR